MKKWNVLRRIHETGIVAVVRAEDAEHARCVSNACLAGGISCIEITYTVSGATDVIRSLTMSTSSEAPLVGAGTVLDAETARIAILAGADFIVGPNFDEATARLCNRYQVPYLPGCMTVAEMVRALETGCDILKLFPGTQFAPSYIKDIKGPLPDVNLMPTGGVSLENVKDWIQNGAVAVGVGGQLTKGPPADITRMAKQLVQAIREARA